MLTVSEFSSALYGVAASRAKIGVSQFCFLKSCVHDANDTMLVEEK